MPLKGLLAVGIFITGQRWKIKTNKAPAESRVPCFLSVAGTGFGPASFSLPAQLWFGFTLYDDLDAAVVGPPLGGIVFGDRATFAPSERLDSIRLVAFPDQILADRIGTMIGKILD